MLIASLAAGICRSAPQDAERDRYGSQGAVLLFVIAVIMAIHGLGALDYRPSASELEMARACRR